MRTDVRHWLPPLLCVALGGCSSCNENAVVVVEEIVSLGEVVDSIEVVQDSNHDGVFATTERAFVVDPRASVDKVLVVRFLAPVPRAALTPPEEFVEFLSFPAPPVSVVGLYFDEALIDDEVAGPDTMVAVFDLSDDLYDPGLGYPAPVVVTLQLDRIQPDLPDPDARVVFVLASQSPPPGPPPRVSSFSPDAAGLAGWSRPFTGADFLPGDDLSDVLARAEGANFVGATLADRVHPHHGIRLGFDQGMSNLVVSVTPEDPLGVRLQAGGLGFFATFSHASSDTSVGMAPDTEYQVIALSKYATINMPMASGTQDGTGLFLMPFMDDALYVSLRAEGYSDEDLALETSYRFRTGPLRIRSPQHKGDVGVQSTGASVPIVVEYVEPPESPGLSVLGLRAEFNGTFVGRSVAATQSETFELVQAQSATRLGFVERAEIELPQSGFDGEVALRVTGFGGASSAEFVGYDEIRFNYDSIIPEIDGNRLTVTNIHPDGRLDELCLVADCDVDHFIIQVPGGREVVLSTEDAQKTACVNDVVEYCFEDVFLGLPPGTPEGELTVTVVAVDDQANQSDPVEFTTRPECTRVAKFVGNGSNSGSDLVSTVTLPNGIPAVAWTSGRDLRYAELAADGSWDANRVTILRRPRDTRTPGDPVSRNFRFGLGFDMEVNQATGRPAVCFVVAELNPETQTESTAAGTMFIMEQSEAGDWIETAQVPGVRPIGCSLTNYRGVLAAAWVSEDATSAEPFSGRPFWGRFFPGLGFFPQARLTRPPALLTSSTLAWDVDLAGTPDALFFTYRASHPLVPSASDAPGSIVAGYFDEGHPSGVAQVVCAPGDTCPTLQQASGTGVSPLMLGAGPRLVVGSATVELAFVNVVEEGLAVWERHGLSFLSSPIPLNGAQFEFILMERESLPGPVRNYASDGLTSQPAVLPPNQVLRSVFYSAPSLALSSDGGTLFASYSRGGDQVGGETVAVRSRDVTSTSSTLDIVEARVGSAPNRQAVVTTSISAGPRGYRVGFFNPAANRVVFSDQHDTELYESGDTNICTQFWRTIRITEDQLNLRFGSNFYMWSPLCFSDQEPQFIPWSWDPDPADGDHDRETIGETGLFAGFIDEQLTGVSLRDGRGPLKAQYNVCVPKPSEAFCHPDLGGSSGFDPPVVTLANGSTTSTVAPAGSGSRTVFATIAEAVLNCPGDAQIVTETDGSYLCVTCPGGSFFEPAADQCVSCADAQFQYAGRPVAERPRFLTRGMGASRCLRCPSDDEDLVARGRMPWVVSSGGGLCTRCQDGSRQLECLADADCAVLGNDEDFRCASTAAWGNRLNAPSGRVCAPRCKSDAGCSTGVCDLGDGDGDNVPDGICRVDGAEVVSAVALACRPIGCDECWNNDYCDDDADCPLNHFCQESLGLAPLCLARPLLSPTVEEVLVTLIPADKQDAVRKSLENARSRLLSTLRTVRVPDTIALGDVPILADVATSFDAKIRGVKLEIVRSERTQQGQIVVRIELTDASAVVSGSPFDIGDFTMRFFYEAHVNQRSDEQSRKGPAYAGVGFTLVGLEVDGSIDIPILPIGSIDLGRAEGTLMGSLGPFANRLLADILSIVGALNEDDASPGISRCLFVPESSSGTLHIPRRCPDGLLEEPHLVEVENGELVVTLRRCQ
jgi:hypothetical protein